MVLNWGTEGIKWKIATQNIIQITYYQAIRSVLVGLFSSLFTPRVIGDFLGRLFSTPAKDKAALTGALLVSGLAQTFISVLLGIFSLPFIYKNTDIYIELEILFVSSLSFFLLLFVLIYYRKKITLFLSKKTRFIRSFLSSINSYSKKTFGLLLFWSLFRHFIFTFQFILIVQLIDYNTPILALLPYVLLIYLTKSIVPSINFLTDLGVRELSSVFFLGLVGVHFSTALTAGMFIWIINIFIPSLVGGIVLWRK